MNSLNDGGCEKTEKKRRSRAEGAGEADLCLLTSDALPRPFSRAAVAAVREHVQALPASEPTRPQRLNFNSLSLYEPSKAAVLLWAGLIPRAELPADIPALVRQADVRPLSTSGSSHPRLC